MEQPIEICKNLAGRYRRAAGDYYAIGDDALAVACREAAEKFEKLSKELPRLPDTTR